MTFPWCVGGPDFPNQPRLRRRFEDAKAKEFVEKIIEIPKILLVEKAVKVPKITKKVVDQVVQNQTQTMELVKPWITQKPWRGGSSSSIRTWCRSRRSSRRWCQW